MSVLPYEAVYRAPVTGHVDQKQYRENIQKVLSFLNGDFQDTIDELTDKMMTASEEMRFEDAAGYRDLIQSIRKIGERQKITAYGEEDTRHHCCGDGRESGSQGTGCRCPGVSLCEAAG